MESKKFSLSEILKLERRPIKIEPEKYYQEIGIYSHGKGIFHKEPRTGFEIGNKKLFMIKEGDFIFQITFAWEGAIALAGPAEDGLYGSVRFPTFRVNKSICDPKYLLYYFKTPNGLYQIGKISPGSAGRNRVLSLKKLPEVKIPLPPLEEQKRIVARIESLMTSIEEARRLRAEAVEDAEELLTATIKKVIFTHEFKFSILKEICETASGGTPSRSRPDYFQGKIPWLKSGELNDDWIADSEEHITEEALRNSNAKVFPKGTLLIALYGATVGKTGILSRDSATNQAICALFPKKDVLERDYLHWFLKFKRNEFLGQSFGGAQPNISQRLLRNIKIPLPSLPVQRCIVAYLDSLQAKVNELKRLQAETEKEMEELIPSILDKAFKGEL